MNGSCTYIMRKVTNLLGVIVILAAVVSVFILPDTGWIDASFGIASGVGLIYTKSSHLFNKIRRLRNDTIKK